MPKQGRCPRLGRVVAVGVGHWKAVKETTAWVEKKRVFLLALGSRQVGWLVLAVKVEINIRRCCCSCASDES